MGLIIPENDGHRRVSIPTLAQSDTNRIADRRSRWGTREVKSRLEITVNCNQCGRSCKKEHHCGSLRLRRHNFETRTAEVPVTWWLLTFHRYGSEMQQIAIIRLPFTSHPYAQIRRSAKQVSCLTKFGGNSVAIVHVPKYYRNRAHPRRCPQTHYVSTCCKSDSLTLIWTLRNGYCIAGML